MMKRGEDPVWAAPAVLGSAAATRQRQRRRTLSPHTDDGFDFVFLLNGLAGGIKVFWRKVARARVVAVVVRRRLAGSVKKNAWKVGSLVVRARGRERTKGGGGGRK